MNKYYIILTAFILGIIGGFIRYEPVLPVFQNNAQPYYHGIKGENKISLTFNVDWGGEYIEDILHILDENNVKATFFVTGNWAQKNKALLKKIANYEHEIGNHGYSHKHPSSLTQNELIDLIKKNENLIFNITGRRTDLFAPPYGEVNDNITKIAADIGYKTIMWSADTIDWQRPSPQIITQRAVNKIKDGGIILMHPTEPTTKALPTIIQRLNDRGFEMVTISELINS